MPTNRTKRKRKNEQVPAWVGKMLETGQPPARDAPGHSEFMGWIFFNELVRGLPDDQNLKHKMMMAAKNAK